MTHVPLVCSVFKNMQYYTSALLFFFFFKEEEIYNVAAAITFDTVDEITVEEEVWV